MRRFKAAAVRTGLGTMLYGGVLVASGTASGLYHCVNAGACSWHDIAAEIARLLGRPARLRPITLETVSLRAKRPRYSALESTRLPAAGIRMPTWQDALARYLGA